jgi:NADH-quinone oxidoreductase subunit L
MFETSEVALGVVTFVGAATCLFAATVGTTQWDIKRVIAYSTCSQLGYMFFAAGVGAYGAAMFHLFTHAFFKALLFLGAGSVIYAMHHEQDMRYYGALRKRIPITFWTMTIGTLAITGVGIYGVFGFAGFYSKDGILEAAYASGGGGVAAFWVGIFAALLTSFYSWRLVFLTFFGKARWEASEHIQHAVHQDHHHHDAHAADDHHSSPSDGTAGYHPHESPWPMLVPLIVLAIGAAFAGFLFYKPFIYAEEGAAFWGNSIAFDAHLMHLAHEVDLWVKWTPFAVMAIGLAIAWYAYIRNPAFPAKFVEQFSVIHNFLYRKWYFDELYDRIFVRPSFAIGRFLWKRGDEGTIDRFGPDGAAALVQGGSRLAVKLQSGYLYGYAFVMLLGLVGLVSWAMVKFQ